MIQPHLPVRLPCYDLVPITSLTLDGSIPQGVRPPASGAAHFHDLTGGVYKARERIHRDVADSRLLATPPSRSRVADCDPDYDWLCGIGSPSRVGNPLYQPLYDVCSPTYKGHEDLTSSPPSSELTPAVPREFPA